MKYLEFDITEQLKDYVQLIWLAESEYENDYYPREKILPDGIVEIVFHFEEPFFTYNYLGEKIKQPKSFAISQMRRYIEIESNGRIGFISVRFFPWGAYHFFDLPIRKFLDDTIDATSLWGEEHESMLNQLGKVCNEEKVKLIQEYLYKCLLKHKKDVEKIDESIKLIRNTKGHYSIDLLCENTGLSYKQLERKFLSTIGTTPKSFSRTTRFLNLCHNLKLYENNTLSQLTAECGYYDQSHFIKDFKDFTSFTPKEYYKQSNICFADF